ncbi:serine hydrolase domain-containing protein [Gracilibacillus kekensis]|uniref:CubicO group peptidase, beta-lactamase class C family n=1 Tax=Gracilibacillus kekensis TaxID=1027249 RepID=A0A1M7QUL2_9BACI|nr:serine hydrolase domain-containing protein [Gracilibacillus kekensis]SHN35605.1 CubicO group peptidase, beta-lactamase class C family [Gracilibacillus kekensis]
MLEHRLDKVLTKFTEKGAAGVALSVRKENQTLYENYFGYADLQKEKTIKDNTIYRIYSMSKLVTCVAGLQLLESGDFLLTDPLSDYLPEFKNMKVLENGKVIEAERDILIKDLFTMTSGITYGGEATEVEKLTRQVMAEIKEKEVKEHTSKLRELSIALANNPLEFHPGSHWKYGLSHDVIGALIEVITGMSLGAYLHQKIFQPLKMNDTFFKIPIAKKNRLAKIYDRQDNGQLVENTWIDSDAEPLTVFESGGAGLHSTLEDYQKFAHCLAQGGTSEGVTLLSNNTIQLMAQNHLPEEMIPELGWNYDNGYGYGLGVRVMIDQAKGGSNSTLGEFGWSGLAGTYVFIDPKKQLSAVYMQQMLPNFETYHQPRIRNIIYGSLN